MAPVAVTAANGTSMRLGSQPALRAPFRPQRPCRAPGRRQELVVRPAEADRSKDQNTVGDMSKDQVQSALDRQIQRSQGKAGTEGGGSNGQGAAAAGQPLAARAAAKAWELPSARPSTSAAADAGAPPKEEPATDVEREESLRALQELKGRVPLMSQDDVQSAIDRLLRQGDSAGESSTSSSSEGGSSGGASSGASAGSDSGGSGQAAAPDSGSGKKGKYDADRTFEDGSLLFTAESLSKVSFDELKP